MPQVKVYSTPTCPHCIRVKAYLTRRNIPFEHIDVSGDEAKLKEMVDVSGQMGVPVIVIDGEVTVGFDQAKIDAKLSL